MKKTLKSSKSLRGKKSENIKDVAIPKSLFTVTAKILGKTYTKTGESLQQIFSDFNIRGTKGKCVLSIERNNQKREKILMPVQAFRLFNSSGFTKEVAIKSVSNLFQGI